MRGFVVPRCRLLKALQMSKPLSRRFCHAILSLAILCAFLPALALAVGGPQSSTADTSKPQPIKPQIQQPNSAASKAASQSATSAPDASKAATEDSKEGIIAERIVTRITFASDGTSTREFSLTCHVQSQSGVQALAVLTFPYLSSNENGRISTTSGCASRTARSSSTPDYNVQDMPADVTRVAPMYSDIHEKHVDGERPGRRRCAGVPGSLSRLVKPQIPGQFWYEEYTSCKDAIAKDHELWNSAFRADKYVKVVSPELQARDQGCRRRGAPTVGRHANLGGRRRRTRTKFPGVFRRALRRRDDNVSLLGTRSASGTTCLQTILNWAPTAAASGESRGADQRSYYRLRGISLRPLRLRFHAFSLRVAIVWCWPVPAAPVGRRTRQRIRRLQG